MRDAGANSETTIATDSRPHSDTSGAATDANVILSFDVEEHHRIEAAAGLVISPAHQGHYRERLEPSTRWILDALAARGAKATFFVLGQIAEHSPSLLRAINDAGHEVASHGWDHRRVTTMSREEFRDDVRKAKSAIEQATGHPVVGYRAPTFSIGIRNPWAIDVLFEEGMLYDSSIYPVRHDRYGVPKAPRVPFVIRGEQHCLLELPPATWRVCGCNVPMGGGGYFRLFPLWFTLQAIRQANCESDPAPAMLYFHPWEFDPGQQRLPLKSLNRLRTYVGIRRNQRRLTRLLNCHESNRALDFANRLNSCRDTLRQFELCDRAIPNCKEMDSARHGAVAR